MDRRTYLHPVLVAVGLAGCGPTIPEADAPRPPFEETRVTVTRTTAADVPAETTGARRPTARDVVAATAADPPARPRLGATTAVLPTAAGEAPLPVPTTLATTRSAVFAFGRTRGGYVVRVLSGRAKGAAWSPAVRVADATDDDSSPTAVADGELVWFAVSSKERGTRLVRVETTGAGPKAGTPFAAPPKLGTAVTLVPLRPHVALVGRDGDAITFARIDRSGRSLDASAKVLARGASGPAIRAPRATAEEDKLLLAWDADDVPGALDAPGTTAEARATPKVGIHVRRFFANGEPAGPARRLTRPSIEAHAIDVVVELGACAVLASTAEGFEMFRFVRKGDDLAPYGGGLHLAPPGDEVALGADVVGTIGLTRTKLLRIGPGVKIVPTPLGFTAPSGAGFDAVRIVTDGYGAHGLFATRTPLGSLPTIARIDGERMGPVLPTPWIGPTPQRLLFAAHDGDEALVLAIDGATVHAIRLGLDGRPRSATPLPIDARMLDGLGRPATVPKAARAGGEWIVALAEGRLLVATGARAGSVIASDAPAGQLAVVPSGGRATALRLVLVPPPEKAGQLQTATVDPKLGTASSWTRIAGSEAHYGALGQARFTAVPRAEGGLYLLTNSGPKVSSVAQIFSLASVAEDGQFERSGIESPAPLQEVSLVPTTTGPAVVATITGRGPAARWLDGPAFGWREGFAFMPFRARGDGPLLREKGAAFVIPPGALPVALGEEISSAADGRCPFALPAGPRALLMVCEEGAADAPLSARVGTRVVEF